MRLNQLRLREGESRLTDEELRTLHGRVPLVQGAEAAIDGAALKKGAKSFVVTNLQVRRAVAPGGGAPSGGATAGGGACDGGVLGGGDTGGGSTGGSGSSRPATRSTIDSIVWFEESLPPSLDMKAPLRLPQLRSWETATTLFGENLKFGER